MEKDVLKFLEKIAQMEGHAPSAGYMTDLAIEAKRLIEKHNYVENIRE